MLGAWSKRSIAVTVIRRWRTNKLSWLPGHGGQLRFRKTFGSLALGLFLAHATFLAQGDEAFTTVPVVGYDLHEARQTSSTVTDFFGRVSLAATWGEANSLRSARHLLRQPGAGPRLSRYLEFPTVKPEDFRLPDESPAASTGAVVLGKLQAGYGKLFDPDSILTRGRNGTVWEDHSFFFVKTCFSF